MKNPEDTVVPKSGRLVDVTRNLTYRVVVLSNTLSRSASRMLAERVGITVPEWRVLSVVGSRPGLSFGALSRALDVDNGWISRVLAKLESSGYVKRTPAPTDGRQFHLWLTEAGQAIHLAGSDVSRERQERLASHFTPSELQVLCDLMGRLQGAADALEQED